MTRIETAVILATDLVGSPALVRRLGSARLEDLRREHGSMLADHVEDHGGRVIKHTGDGLLASFPSVSAAVAAGVVIQQHVARRERTAASEMSVRVGISVGDAALDDDGDYFGIPPIEATRLCAKAGAGQILIADPACAMVRGRAGHRFEPMAPLELKGLPEPVTAWRVAWDPLPRLEGAPLPARLRAPPTAHIGRAAEQAVLLEHWDQAIEGRRQAVLISGEPGVGKTQLVTQAARAALPDDAIVLYGRCAEQRGTPYHAWLEIVRGYVAITPRRLLRRHAGELALLVPELRGRLGDAPASPPGDAGPDAERYLLFSAVGALLAAAAERAPVVVILDDLQWADEPTLALLKYVVTTSTAGRLLLLATFRDADLGPDARLSHLLADLRREPAVTRVALAGLDAAEVCALIEAMAGHRLDDDGLALATRVHRETTGNPLRVGRMLGQLREAGAISVDPDGRWSFADAEGGGRS